VDVVVDNRLVLDSPVVDTTVLDNAVVDTTVVDTTVVSSVEEVDNAVVLVAIFEHIKRPFSFLVQKTWRTFSAHVQNDELDMKTTVGLNLYPGKRRSSATEL